MAASISLSDLKARAMPHVQAIYGALMAVESTAQTEPCPNTQAALSSLHVTLTNGRDELDAICGGDDFAANGGGTKGGGGDPPAN